MTYSNELETAKKAAREAAGIIRKYDREQSFSVDLKSKNDLVTDADIASEKAIISCIRAQFPGDEILAEESTGTKALPEGRVWIIDPVDGTTNFAHGFPVYCISIALWENREAKAGLVLEVSRDECFTAVKGEGAFLNGEPIRVSREKEAGKSLIGTGFPYKNLDLVDDYLRLFRYLMEHTHGVRRPGSAAWDLCNVACGRFEGFYEYGLSAWDVAAGSLIVQEAGGVISDWMGTGEWLFGQRIIAGNIEIHKFLENQIRFHFSEEARKSS